MSGREDYGRNSKQLMSAGHPDMRLLLVVGGLSGSAALGLRLAPPLSKLPAQQKRQALGVALTL